MLDNPGQDALLPSGHAGAPAPVDFVSAAVRDAGLAPKASAAVLDAWAAAQDGAAGEAAASKALLANLRAARLHPSADLIARAAAARFPEQSWPLIDLAESRARLGNHQGMLALGQEIIAAFPDEGEGPRFALAGLMGLGRKQDAQTLFREVSLDPALHGLHRVEWFLSLGITLGLARGDYALVDLYAVALREVAPENPDGYAGGAVALRKLGRRDEARAVAMRGTELHPDVPALWKEAAAAMRGMSEPERAYDIYEEMIRRFPDSPAGYTGALHLSVQLPHPATTRALLARALAAFPSDKSIVGLAARQALKENNPEQAAKHWRTLIKQSPDDPKLRLTAAMSLFKQRKGRRQRLPAVLRALDKIHSLFPDFVPAYTAHLVVLREASRNGEASRLSDSVGKRFPRDPELAVARAQIHEECERFNDAVRVLKAVRKRAASAEIEAAYIRALCLAGRFADAEKTCQAALEKFPDETDILTEYVRIATRQGDFIEAMRRCAFAQQRRPRDTSLTRLALSIRVQLVGDEAELGGFEPVVGSLAAVDVAPEQTAVMLACESLGATSAGCEFGLVQRRFGAEPFGMFRWALIGIDRLTTALDNGFAQVGSDETTELAIRRESATHQEYYVVDKTVGYLTHTFVKAEDSPQDRMLKTSVRRVRFLRDKLIENLHAAEKVFIYKFAMKFDEAALRRMFASLRKYGPCTLLCVTFADQNHPNGELQMLEPGLFVGRTGMFMDAVVPDEHGVDTETWFAHCRDVVAWHKTQRAA